MLRSIRNRLRALRWPRVLALALLIVVVPAALAWPPLRVDPEFHALWMLLSRARTLAATAGPVTVRFTDWGAVVEDRHGAVFDTLFLATLAEVRYQTTQGDRRIVFSPGGPTSPYNLHLHGGDATLLADVEARKTVLLREINQHNLGYFEQEVQKLDAWADDLKLGLEQEIKQIDREIKEVRRTAATSPTLEERNPSNGIRKFKVRGLSIINGAQTVASAAEFVAQHPGSNIDDAKVMLTLIKAPADGPFGERVTKARNHQNPVQTANFASLDENQERLRQEIAHLGFEYHYRPEAVTNGTNAITLDEALRALALQQNDPRYIVWLKSEPARLANPDSVEYQTLLPISLAGMALVNAVLCHRAIRTLVVRYEQGAAVRSQEKLIYRHAVHVITSVMMKCLRRRIGAMSVIDPATISALISQPLDQLRQQTFDLGQQRLFGEGPLAYFRNQSNVVAFLADLMETHFALGTDPAIAPLRNIQNAADAYPRKRLIDYLSNRAPQL